MAKKTRHGDVVLDDVDRRLLGALSRDGRCPAAVLAKELGLSRQAVTERIRELERRHIIRGYRADVDASALGLPIRAHVRLTLVAAAGRAKERELLRLLTATPQVRSVYRVSGEDCFEVGLVCRRIEDVSVLLQSLKDTRTVQSSRTAFVLETVLDKGSLGIVEAPLLAPPDSSP
jgi:Lrp/AsnC family transcriptional regulator, leucine-responsive regulatory protein